MLIPGRAVRYYIGDEAKPVMAVTLQVSPVAPFDPHVDANSLCQRWKRWVRAFELYVGASGVKDDKKKRQLLLHCAGMDVQDIFYTFPATGTDYKTANDKLTAHFTPKQNISYNRHVFRKEVQKEGESVGQFVTRLRQLAALCEFGDQVDDFIRDQVVDNCRSKRLRTKLLAEQDLTLDRTLALSAATEAAEHQAAQIAHDEERVSAVATRVRENTRPRSSRQRAQGGNRSQAPQDNKPTCNRCGTRVHAGDVCQRTKGKKCFKCGQQGHFSRVCKQSKTHEEPPNPGVRYVSEPSSGSDDDYRSEYAYAMSQSKSVTMTVGDVPISMLIDSGSTCNTLNSECKEHLVQQGIALMPCKRRIHPYNSPPIPVHQLVRESVEATRSEKERLVSLLEAKEKDILARSQACDALEKEKDDLGELFEEQSGRLAKASESIEQLEREKGWLEELVHQTQAQVLQRSAEEEQTRAQGQGDFERVQAKLENEEKAKQLLQSENDDLQNRLSHKSKELDAAKLQIDQLEKDFSELSAHKEMLQMDFEDNDTYISSLEEKVGNLRGAKTQMEQKLSAREEAVGALKTELEKAMRRLQAAESRDDKRKVDEDDLKRKLQNLVVQLEAAKEAKSSYGDEVVELQKRCDELSEVLEERDEELGEAKESAKTQKSRADEVKVCLQQKLDAVQSERDPLEKKCDELSGAQSALLERVEKLALESAAANSETESSASRFRLTIESLKLAKGGLEKVLSESQRVLSCAAQLDEENRTKLEELTKSTALKQENYSLTEQKLREEASKVDSLEQELKDAASKLRATEEALETAEAKVEELSNGKSLSEGTLTAVHARLQSCEKAMVEKDAAIIELEETLSRRDKELQELSGENDTRQSQLTETENSLRSAQEARVHAEKKAAEERAWITQDFSRREQVMRDLLENEKQTSSSLEEEIGIWNLVMQW